MRMSEWLNLNENYNNIVNRYKSKVWTVSLNFIDPTLTIKKIVEIINNKVE